MPINDFLPIATAVGAPVLTQAAWAAATPASGRGPGILPKEYFNKANRQSSVMAAAIGLFLNNQGQDALDNGDIPGLAAAFAAALGGANAQAFFSLLIQDSYAAGTYPVVRTVNLIPGNYRVCLESNYGMNEASIGAGAYDNTCTQSGIVALGGNSATCNTAARVFRGGGGGYGRNIFFRDFQLSTLTVPTAGAYVMSITATSQSGGGNAFISGKGSILTVERVG